VRTINTHPLQRLIILPRVHSGFSDQKQPNTSCNKRSYQFLKKLLGCIDGQVKHLAGYQLQVQKGKKIAKQTFRAMELWPTLEKSPSQTRCGSLSTFINLKLISSYEHAAEFNVG